MMPGTNTSLINIYLYLWLNGITTSQLTYEILSKLFNEDALALLDPNNLPILMDLEALFDEHLNDDQSDTDSIIDDDTWHDNPGALSLDDVQQDYFDNVFESFDECGSWIGDKDISTPTKSFNVAMVVHPQVEYQAEPIELDDIQSVMSEIISHDDDSLLFQFDEDLIDDSSDENNSYAVLQIFLENTVKNIFAQSMNQAATHVLQMNQVFVNLIAQEIQSITQESIEEMKVEKLASDFFKFESDDELERLNRTLSYDSIAEIRNVTPFRDFCISPKSNDSSNSRPNSALTLALDAERREMQQQDESINLNLISPEHNDDVIFLMDEDLENIEKAKKQAVEKSPQSVVDGIKSPVNISTNVKVANFSFLRRAIMSPIQSQRAENDFESIEGQSSFQPGAPRPQSMYFSNK